MRKKKESSLSDKIIITLSEICVCDKVQLLKNYNEKIEIIINLT